MKNKTTKIISILLMLCIILSFAGCDGGGSGDYTVGINGYDSSSKSESLSVELDGFAPGNGTSNELSDVAESGSTSKQETQETDQEYLKRKIVYTADISAQTKDLDKAKTDINKMIEGVNGYVEDEYYSDNGSIYNGYSYRRINMTVRIPSQNFDGFVNGLKSDNLYINNMDTSSTDYSTAYYDKESRISSLRIQETRLHELLKEAKNVEIMLQIERELSDIRYEIESLTKEMRFIDSNVAYSTVELRVEEVVKYDESNPEPKNFVEEMLEVIKNSGSTFANIAKTLLFTAIYLLPYAVIATVIIVIVKIRKGKKK